VGVIPLEDFCQTQEILLDESVKESIDLKVRRAAYNIIEGKGATYYGIGSALSRIVNAVLSDQRAVLTVCSSTNRVAEVPDVTLALPHIVGGQGIVGTLPLPLSPEEEDALQASANTIKTALDQLESTL
jgi:L-lactate dehydrogenase